ncbi:MAG: HD domain-containing protein [Chloroflexota bacterium]|nr:HD domain-containing protein [Chloroflexota bacterium]
MRAIDTRVFQRLRNIKQLGLVSLVFPGADYSRFSHSLGACHLMGRAFDALNQSGAGVADDMMQRYRLAALLHDVGHYPYSHLMEDVLRDFYAGSLLSEPDDDPGAKHDEPRLTTPPNHERVGKEILEQDEELIRVLEAYSVQPQEIFNIFMRQENPPFVSLMSSDLDVDRLDYLQRTATHSGLPYGAVDVDYLMSQLTLDTNGMVCLTKKALRTADHFLLARNFDYQQVAYHKTVAAFELVLKDVIRGMLTAGFFQCDSNWVKDAIRTSKWPDFDDARMLGLIREYAANLDRGSTDLIKARAVLDRRPPKMVANVEFVERNNSTSNSWYVLRKQSLLDEMDKIASELRIDRNLWYEWRPSKTAFTKGTSELSAATLNRAEDIEQEREHLQESIMILDDHTGVGKPLMLEESSWMKVLSNYRRYSFRIYLLTPDDNIDQVREVRARLLEKSRSGRSGGDR